MADEQNGGGGQQPKTCAVCKYQRKRCPADCVFAPYFAAHRTRDFKAVHEVFGVSNASKMLKNQDDEQRRGMAAEAMIWDALEWERNPVLGPQGVCQRLTDEKQALVSQMQERTQQMGLLMKQVEWQKQEIAFLETQLLDIQRSSPQNQMMMMFPGFNQTASGRFGAPAHHQMVPFPPLETQIRDLNQRDGNNNNNNNRAVQDAGSGTNTPTHHTNNGNWVGQDQREGHVNMAHYHHSGQIPTEQQYYRESNGGRSFDQSMMPQPLRFDNAQAVIPISNNGEGRENFNGGAGSNWQHHGNHGGSYSIPLQGGGGGGNNGGVQGLGNGNGLAPSHQTGMSNAHAGEELGAFLQAHWPDSGL